MNTPSSIDPTYPTTFNGIDLDAISWWNYFENWLIFKQWLPTEEEVILTINGADLIKRIIALLNLLFKRSVLDWFTSLPSTTKNSYIELKNQFFNRYNPKTSK